MPSTEANLNRQILRRHTARPGGARWPPHLRFFKNAVPLGGSSWTSRHTEVSTYNQNYRCGYEGLDQDFYLAAAASPLAYCGGGNWTTVLTYFCGRPELEPTTTPADWSVEKGSRWGCPKPASALNPAGGSSGSSRPAFAKSSSSGPPRGGTVTASPMPAEARARTVLAWCQPEKK